MKRQLFSNDKPLLKRFRASSSVTLESRQLENSGFRNLIRDYQIGPLMNTSPLHCIKTYLALRDEKFYKLKILVLDDKPTKENVQAKSLMHNEFCILDSLKDLSGIEKCQEIFIEELTDSTSQKPQRRITLVLNSASGDKSCENWMNINLTNNINLQEYISRCKLTEKEALAIFHDMTTIVEDIHNRNVIHRDLKLQNFLINMKTRRITLTSFSLAKQCSDTQLLLDQKGSPAYISPEILNGNYKGKPSDCWSLGVILFILIYSTFPFVESSTAALFKKISMIELIMPPEKNVSEATKKLLKNHLLTSSNDRFTAKETRQYLERQFYRINRNANMLSKASHQKDDQVVPNIQVKHDSNEVDRPKLELSRENMSSMLRIISPNTQQEQKMFLKPSLLAERCNRISVSPQSSSSSNLTRQINNLSVRNRQQTNSGLSWHNRISSTSLYEVRFRAAESNIMNDRVRMHQSGLGAASSFEAIYNTLNELFSSGNFPANAIVHEFNGSINQDLALKLSIWLRTNFHDNFLVREIYNSSSSGDVEKIVEFLKRCQVQFEDGSTVKAQQTNQVLIFMTYLLQLSGYNNNYFLNISRS